jgi:RNA polymerase sigma-54 factor
MTPQLLQSIRMLQLSSLELEQEIHQALENNLMLEQEDDSETEESTPADVEETHSIEAVAVTASDASALEQVQEDFDWSSAESWSGGEPMDDDNPIEDRTPALQSEDVRIRALEQLRTSLNDPMEMRIALAIVEAVDENGYLEASLQEIAEQIGDEDVTEQDIAAVLHKVQAVEPSGFAARNLRECLLLQLRDLPRNTAGLELANAIVREALHALGTQDYAALREVFKVDDRALSVAISLVLALNPKPGASANSPARVVVPDVIVSGRPGNWKIDLNSETLPRVRVNSLYERLLVGSSGHRTLRDQLQEARWLVRGLEMRNTTLLKTARAIFERQSKFLVGGEEAMMPLTLREIAETIEMHESTVCRVTTNKYVQTPWGIYELKDFFPSLLGGTESETSGTAVKAIIRRIIDGESQTSPLCDGAIAALLHRQGIRVARRTVAKYREGMKIASAKERRVKKLPRHALRIAV